MQKLIPALLAFGVIATGGVALAQAERTAGGSEQPQGPKITFPVAELGGCSSRQECKTYCDDPAHTDACISFAEKNRMMSAEDAAQARKFSKQTGPGGCMGSKCRAYCSESAHFDECRKFAEEHGLAPKVKDLRAKEPKIDEDKAEAVLAESGGPGGCKTKDECKTYCTDAARMDECLKFAEEHGLMQKDDVALARKLMSETGPGGCKGIACKDYCEDEAHATECLDFAEKNGLMDKEDAAKARTIMEKGGPGGCKGRACERYCSDPAHQEACLSFAKDNGLISPEDADRMQQMMQRMRGGEDDFRMEPPEGFDDSAENGPPPGFRQMEGGMPRGMQRFEDSGRDFAPPGQLQHGMTGPGGCTSRDECEAYCRANPNECGRGGPLNRPPQEYGEGPRDFDAEGEGGERRFSPQDIERAGQFIRENGPQMMQMLQQQMERGEGMPMQGEFDEGRFGPPPPEGGQFSPPPQDGASLAPPPSGDGGADAPPPPPPPTSALQNDRFTASVFSVLRHLLGR